jgi:hypothetical protein
VKVIHSLIVDSVPLKDKFGIIYKEFPKLKIRLEESEDLFNRLHLIAGLLPKEALNCGREQLMDFIVPKCSTLLSQLPFDVLMKLRELDLQLTLAALLSKCDNVKQVDVEVAARRMANPLPDGVVVVGNLVKGPLPENEEKSEGSLDIVVQCKSIKDNFGIEVKYLGMDRLTDYTWIDSCYKWKNGTWLQGSRNSILERCLNKFIINGSPWVSESKYRLPSGATLPQLIDWALLQACQYLVNNAPTRYGVVGLGPMIFFKEQKAPDYIDLREIDDKKDLKDLKAYLEMKVSKDDEEE